MTTEHKQIAQDTIIKPRCMIAACGRELVAELETTESLEKAGCKITVSCDNGVGFKHVVTASGEHYGVRKQIEDNG